MKSFSALMSVYKNDDPHFFSQAIDSILNQTIPPAEIVLVRDGEVPEPLQQTIDTYLCTYGGLIRYIPLAENQGLGNALRIGVEAAKHDLIARMDSDDIAVPNRFELQLTAFEAYPEVDIVGGQIAEFVETEDNIVSRRIVPIEHAEIVEYCKTRSPVNHVTVMFRRSAVLNAGNYVEVHFVEDYYLWCRMVANGCRFLNLDAYLVNVRVGSAMYHRRGGWRYFQSLKFVEKHKLNNKLIGKMQFIRNILMRFAQCVLVSERLLGVLYKNIARKGPK